MSSLFTNATRNYLFDTMDIHIEGEILSRSQVFAVLWLADFFKDWSSKQSPL